MLAISSNTAPTPIPCHEGAFQTLQLPAGALVHDGQGGQASWRLVSGAIRLDHPTHDKPVRLALPGDVIGTEELVTGMQAFTSRAVVPSELEHWQPAPGTDVTQAILQEWLRDRQSADEQWMLRAGSADERLAWLIYLLSKHERVAGKTTTTIYLPSLQDMADLTAQTIETVSRSISRLRKQALLRPLSQRRFEINLQDFEACWLRPSRSVSSRHAVV